MTTSDCFDFDFDLQRSITLCKYISYWGFPKSRRIWTEEGTGERIEVYFFPGEPSRPHRFASIGVPNISKGVAVKNAIELLVVLQEDLGKASLKEIFDYIVNIALNCWGRDNSPSIGEILNSSSICPKLWKPRMTLFDEARGEEEDISTFHVGKQHVDLMWLIPVYPSECNILAQQGLDELDDKWQSLNVNPIDVLRKDVISDY